jgi:hypothetical protein
MINKTKLLIAKNNFLNKIFKKEIQLIKGEIIKNGFYFSDFNKNGIQCEPPNPFPVGNKGYSIVNIDSNIIAQEPKMMPYIPKMKTVLAKILEISPKDISIKAKTKENLDAVGQKLAIEANAVVLLLNKG